MVTMKETQGAWMKGKALGNLDFSYRRGSAVLLGNVWGHLWWAQVGCSWHRVGGARDAAQLPQCPGQTPSPK